MTLSGCTIELRADTGKVIIAIVVQILKNVSSFFISRPNLQKHSSTIRARANQGNVASGIFRMRVLHRAVAVFAYTGRMHSSNKGSVRQKERAQSSCNFNYCVKAARSKTPKKIAPNKTSSARPGSGEWNKSYGCSGCVRRGR